MIHELIVGKFISVIKKEKTPQEFIQESKDKLNEWYQNKIGDWIRVISVEENKENILESIIKIEIWDITQFNPIHSEAYSYLTTQLARIKENN